MEVNQVIELAVTRLKAANLFAFPDKKRECIVVATPSCKVINDGAIIEFDGPDDDYSSIRLLEFGWYFIKYDGIPGPVYNDTICRFFTLDEAVTAAINYHTGKPIVVGDWICPIHQHPEWNIEKLSALIPQAKLTTLTEWQNIESYFDGLFGTRVMAFMEGRSVPKWEGDGWEWPIFVMPINHVSRSDLTLWVRRDLEQAWIVAGN
ncbi:MAG: hypothetical protein ABI947_15665 [Chloroflexota bacterium]